MRPWLRQCGRQLTAPCTSGMYIGSVSKQTETVWVYEDERLVQREVDIYPGLLKVRPRCAGFCSCTTTLSTVFCVRAQLFDEILVNAADNKQRDPAMRYIRVDVEQLDDGGVRVTVENDGRGIPVHVHAKESTSRSLRNRVTSPPTRCVPAPLITTICSRRILLHACIWAHTRALS